MLLACSELTMNIVVRLSRFVKMIAAVRREDWGGAADEMENSLWFRQVGERGRELVRRMRNARN